jgi:proteic killer suppression protein
MEKPSRVWITKFAEKQIRRLPKHIVAAYYTWVRTIELDGVRAMRALPGYHDEPLKGDRKGQRSVRLSKSYRVIYEETESGNVVLIGVQEVNKHEY